MSPIKSSKRENEKEKELQYLINPDFLHSLDKNSELLLVKVPKGVHPDSLLDQDISGDFTIGASAYATSIQKGEQGNLCIVGSEDGEMSSFAFKTKRIFTIREKVAEPAEMKPSVLEPYIVPQITGTKLRHPIYGAEFVDNLKRSSKWNTDENLPPSPKKKKIKKEKKR